MGENMNIDKKTILNAILNSSDSKINKNAVKKAAGGDVSGLIEGLDDQSKKKLNAALSDKNKAKEILASKEAREILKSFLGGKNNG